jgi:hypothetical protein
MYEVGSHNRSIRQNSLPFINNRSSLSSFLGSHTNSLRSNSLDIPRVVIDGNRLIYPLISNPDNTNLKDPQWKNLLGINYLSQGIIPFKSPDQNHLILNIMQIQKGILIPHILRYDIDQIRSILNETNLLKLILDERLDGCRNLFHACIHIAIPLTNQESVINDEQNSNEMKNKRIPFAGDLFHSQTNTDHNYEHATRFNNPSEQPINTWPPSGSTTNFHRVIFYCFSIRSICLLFRIYPPIQQRI